MDSSQFSHNQDIIDSAEPLDVSGATCHCYRVKLYGKLHFLKRLKPELRTNPRHVAALHKEFETGYNLDHPHLVRYLSCGDDYLLTEYIDGSTLLEFAKQNPEFFKSKANVSRLLGSLLDVVEYLHSHQVVHLDLKPQNILITRVGHELKLTDLGFCYTDTFADTMGQTNSFAAPEQLDGSSQVDHRTDIYALGRIIATLPCAKRYRKVIDRCTKPSKEDRYQSVTELKKELSNPRIKWPLVAAIAASACLIGLTAWWLFSSQPANPVSTTLPTTDTIAQQATAATPPDTTAKPKVAEPAMPQVDNSNHAAQPIPTTYEPSTAPSPPATVTPNPTPVTINKETLRSQLIAATQPIYDKYLKQYENETYIDSHNTAFKEAYHNCDNEIADKLFRLWETKYKPMGVLESDYNPIAVKVIHYHTEKVDKKVKY